MKNIPTDNQTEAAHNILKTASLLNKQSMYEDMCIMGKEFVGDMKNVDAKYWEDIYIIRYKKAGLEENLTVKSNDERMVIKMCNAKLISAIGIEEEDIIYWQKVEEKICC